MKLIQDFGVRALLAVTALMGHYAGLLFVIITYELSYDQVFAILTESALVAGLGLKWYFEKKKEDV